MDRKVDGLGRVTIPKEVRNQLQIEDNSYVELSVEDGAIVLRPKERTILDWRRTTKFELDEKKINQLKEKYHKGDRVRLINMESEAYLVPRDTEGTVVGVDDLGSVHVNWDNGMCVAVLNLPGEAIEKIK